jgi:hypothetical protein
MKVMRPLMLPKNYGLSHIQIQNSYTKTFMKCCIKYLITLYVQAVEQSWLFKSSNRSQTKQRFAKFDSRFELFELKLSKRSARFEFKDILSRKSVLEFDSTRTRIEPALAKLDISNTLNSAKFLSKCAMVKCNTRI